MFEIYPADLWGKSACFRQEIKKLSSLCEFKYNKGALFDRLGSNFDVGLRTMIDHIDEVFVVEFGEEISFNLVSGLLAGTRKIDFKSV